ncbi:hypothetical protein Emag_001722 [Eimeria magna]
MGHLMSFNTGVISEKSKDEASESLSREQHETSPCLEGKDNELSVVCKEERNASYSSEIKEIASYLLKPQTEANLPALLRSMQQQRQQQQQQQQQLLLLLLLLLQLSES